MKVDGSLKSLLQGVSQQPPRDRLPGQCSEQINMSADPIDGLTTRPPTDLVGQVGSAVAVRAWHDFQMQDGNKFLMGVREDGTVFVTDLNSTPHAVTITNGEDYLSADGLLRFYTDEDDNRTFITNSGVVPAMTVDVKAYANAGGGKPHMAILQVLGGGYARKFSITVNGTLRGSYKPPNGATATDIDKVRTSHIAERLVTSLTDVAGTTAPDGATSELISTAYMAASPWTVTRYEDVILIANSTTAFDVSVSDDSGNVNFKAMSTQVSGVEDLPRIAPYGYIVRVSTEVDPEKDVWLQFVTESTYTLGLGFGAAGYWTEAVKPGIEYMVDKDTMPHVVTYDPGTGEFTVNYAAWTDRRVGTDVSNPQPSFVGLPINDISAIQSRLVLVAGKNFIGSRTNDFFDFFRGSAAAKSDSDPIDISSTSEEGSLLAAIVPHDKDLVIFARGGGQFVVYGSTALTPDNAALVPTTAYEAQLDAAPVASGKNVFFATEFGRYTGMREFFTSENSDANDARPITDHIKKYIVGKATRLIASANHGMLITSTDAAKETLYLYQYIWNGLEKVQSAWGKWVFSKPAEHTFFVNDRVYYVLSSDSEYFLHRMALDVLDEDAIGFPVMLDSRFDVLAVNTEFLLPHDWMNDQELVCVQGEDCPNPGMNAPILSVAYSAPDTAWKVTLRDDMGGGDIVCGIKYLRWYVPTMPLVKDQDGVVVSTGKLKVKNFVVSLLNTGYVVAQMISRWGNGPALAFNGRIVGAVDNVVGETTLTDSDFTVPFRERTDRAEIAIYSDNYLPMAIVDVDFVGQYSKRGKRISTGG